MALPASIQHMDAAELVRALHQDKRLAEKVADHLGRPADPTGGGQKVLHLKTAYGFKMEWHPVTRKLYLVPDAPEPGESAIKAHLIAENVEDHGMALNMANVFGRGYNLGVHWQQQGRAKTNRIPIIKKDC